PLRYAAARRRAEDANAHAPRLAPRRRARVARRRNSAPARRERAERKRCEELPTTSPIRNERAPVVPRYGPPTRDGRCSSRSVDRLADANARADAVRPVDDLRLLLPL